MRVFLIAVLAALLTPNPASAGWSKCPGEVNTETDTPKPSSSSGPICYNFTDTTDSPLVDVRKCREIAYRLNADEDGTATGAEVYLRECEESTASVNHCSIAAVDINGDGVLNSSDEVTLTGAVGRRGVRKFQPSTQYVYVDVSVNAGSDDARVTLKCH